MSKHDVQMFVNTDDSRFCSITISVHDDDRCIYLGGYDMGEADEAVADFLMLAGDPTRFDPEGTIYAGVDFDETYRTEDFGELVASNFGTREHPIYVDDHPDRFNRNAREIVEILRDAISDVIGDEDA